MLIRSQFQNESNHALNLFLTLTALTEPRLDFKNSVIMNYDQYINII